MPLQAVFL